MRSEGAEEAAEARPSSSMAAIRRSMPIDAPTPGSFWRVYSEARSLYRPPEQTEPIAGRSLRKVSKTTPV